MSLPSISPTELSAELKAERDLVLLDVRNDDELAICKLSGIAHIPLAELGDRFSELSPESEIVTICKGGFRSARAAEFLIEQGYTNVRNMTGGMLAWIDEVDSSLQKY